MSHVPTGKGTEDRQSVRGRPVGGRLAGLARQSELLKGSVMIVILNNFLKFKGKVILSSFFCWF